MKQTGLPRRQGLYDPAHEHDACGVGFVANVRGERSHAVVERGLHVLRRLEHRGACGCDPDSGDGAGLLLQVPDAFLRRECARLNIALPAAGAFAVGMVFLAQDAAAAARQRALFEDAVRAEGQRVLGWRVVPVAPDAIGWQARAGLPRIEQVFVGAEGALAQDVDAFERKLYVIRRLAEKAAGAAALRDANGDAHFFYVPSFSARTIVYTGMLIARQIARFFPDLADPEFASAMCIVHSRYSTNTLGAWDLAHPFRYLAHNGEINTIEGNQNWMRAREGTMESAHFGDDLRKLYPIVRAGASDSARFDNVLEFLCLAGRSLPEAVLMMIPEAWESRDDMDPPLRACYEFHSFLMEPWDGPASVVFSDGRCIGAVLDRNGLRPSRYIVTEDDCVVMASEVGVVEVEDSAVVEKQRLHPGRIFMIDLEAGRILDDAEVKRRFVNRRPWLEWVESNRLRLDDLPHPRRAPDEIAARERFVLQQAFGYTQEDLKLLLAPMSAHGKWPIGSMGEDAALACLSERPQLLYRYFKQRFAQVSNPAMDSINERPVMALYSTLGREGNLLGESEAHARMLRIEHPVISDVELGALREMEEPGFAVRTLSCLFRADAGGAGLARALDALCEEAERAVEDGANILILSDRGVSAELAPLPMLLATGAVHHHLIRKTLRTRCGLVCETGEAREVAHMALLIGYGAAAVNPYLAFASIAQWVAESGAAPDALDLETAHSNFVAANDKGLLKTFAKMGISTLQSYRGAQIFEAVGLSEEVIERAFTGTISKVSGVGFEALAREALMRHARAFPGDAWQYPELDPGGLYQWRARGERHSFNPDTVAKLQIALSRRSYEGYREFSKAADADATSACTLRGLFRFRERASVPVEEVEPASEIVKRFCTGAMSYGSISIEAHQTLAVAMNRLGGKSNTGEGGEDAERFTPDANGDSRRSAIKQVASGRFGVTSWYLVNADEMQIKVAQGAKPGEGGELPGHKVNETIAAVRHSTPGVGLISPPPHHDIYSIEDLAQLIFDLKNANRAARVSVKLVSVSGVGTIAAGVAKGKADGVLISGMDGGTGASPQASIKYAGLPWEIGLAETQQTLVLNDLRGRIRVQADGGLKTGRDVVIAALLGADEFGFSTAPLVALGCILMRVCHLNTCPVGIATQDPVLRARFAGAPESVVQYLLWVAEEAREYMALLGFRSVDEMVGRTEALDVTSAEGHWKRGRLDFSALFHKPRVPHAIFNNARQTLADELEASADVALLPEARAAIERGEKVVIERATGNTERALGAILGSEISKRHGAEGLPDDTLTLRLHGSAGQSLGAFGPRGLTIEVEGDANDYAGKGLCGAKLVVRAPRARHANFDPAQNIIVGNVVLYGATGGVAYFHGLAGERFCVRNSGADAVVEGVGDHGCEYMTGGRVVILGAVGRNFAAGMSGGYAYVFDADNLFDTRVNPATVDLEALNDEDFETLQRMLRAHLHHTGSARADEILRKWDEFAPRFVKVFPKDYKRALGERIAAESGNG